MRQCEWRQGAKRPHYYGPGRSIQDTLAIRCTGFGVRRTKMSCDPAFHPQ